MIGQTIFHCGSDADRTVNPHEIVIGEVKGERGIVVFPVLAESICQPGKATNLHSHHQVLTFSVRGGNLLRIGTSDNWDNLRCHNIGGRIALLAFARSGVYLDELRKIN
jgi:hypothetical protein